MITLHLALNSSKDIEEKEFKCFNDYADFILSISHIESVWLLTGGNDKEILVTENLEFTFIPADFGMIPDINNAVIYLQEYNTYEDAYRVALSMREVNPKCYNK